MPKKRRYTIAAVLLLVFLIWIQMVPTHRDYERYLIDEHGLCNDGSETCITSGKQVVSQHVRMTPWYMAAESKLTDGSEIRVIGVFHMFLIRKNTLPT